jgi:crotonobetainyl-CoA:carnitine CoA-transferase CaiB-like acyl-CoA transferase
MVVEDRRGWEHLGIPIKFADEPGTIRFDPPAQGQHAEEILRGLGYSDADLVVMKADGVY